MNQITTHVLDLYHGRPAEGVPLRLYRSDSKELLVDCRTDLMGRAACVPPEKKIFESGWYEIVFAIASYFTRKGVILPDPPFLDEIVIRFGISKLTNSLHIPLLVTPWSYTVYRGQ